MKQIFHMLSAAVLPCVLFSAGCSEEPEVPPATPTPATGTSQSSSEPEQVSEPKEATGSGTVTRPSSPVSGLSMPDDADLAPPTMFISPARLQEMIGSDTPLVLIDARKSEEFEKGHLPTAINLPPSVWRTGKAATGQGVGQLIYRQGDPSDAAYSDQPVDVAYYEKLLGEAGVSHSDTVVVYGNHPGKSDGSVPAMILHMLGHPPSKLFVLNGKGYDRWAQAGGAISKGLAGPRVPATYEADYRDHAVWTLRDVSSAVQTGEKVVFYDTHPLRVDRRRTPRQRPIRASARRGSHRLHRSDG